MLQALPKVLSKDLKVPYFFAKTHVFALTPPTKRMGWRTFCCIHSVHDKKTWVVLTKFSQR